ncbi:MAG TPA: hypothetical protein VFD90_19460 [Gaiellales bacterium]|jgi:hypothetical protein|nr:hypothetical protein [Gaiellales bacterium]
MGLFDKVKDEASDVLETVKGAAHTQQLKLHLRKHDGELDEAHAAFGAAAFDLFEAGTLSSSSDLAAPAARVRDARAAVEAKKAEIATSAADDSDGSNGAGGAAGGAGGAGEAGGAAGGAGGAGA